jgi:hypothetical protein
MIDGYMFRDVFVSISLDFSPFFVGIFSTLFIEKTDVFAGSWFIKSAKLLRGGSTKVSMPSGVQARFGLAKIF